MARDRCRVYVAVGARLQLRPFFIGALCPEVSVAPVCQPGCRVRDPSEERAMNGDSKPGSEAGGGRKEEGIAALGRKEAGIDVGSKGHWVCAPAREGEEGEVQVFGATPPELEKMAGWLLEGSGIGGVGEHGGVLDSGPRGLGEAWIGSAAGRYAGVKPERRGGRRRIDATANGSNGCTVAGCCRGPFGQGSRSACCARGCGTKGIWWRTRRWGAA